MEQKNITGTTIINRNTSRFLVSPMGGELVMMDMENGDYVALNSVGADIWRLLEEQSLTVGELLKKLLDIYNISEEQCRFETISFLKKAIDRNLLLTDKPVNV